VVPRVDQCRGSGTEQVCFHMSTDRIDCNSRTELSTTAGSNRSNGGVLDVPWPFRIDASGASVGFFAAWELEGAAIEAVMAFCEIPIQTFRVLLCLQSRPL